MRTLIILLCAFSFSNGLAGQESTGKSTTSGKIIFEEKVKLEIKIEGDAAQFAESLPKERVTGKVLIFNPDFSVYKTDATKSDVGPVSHQSGNMTIRMVVSGANDITFYDIVNKKRTEQKEFMTRMFLVEDDMENEEWKFTGNNRVIAGYYCQEAVKEQNGKKVSAWFAPSIPVATGPAGFGGLPGLILMADIDNGKHIFTALSVDPAFSDAAQLAKPDEGKKVTSEEFKKIVDEKMKEMGRENGEGGNQIFIRTKR